MPTWLTFNPADLTFTYSTSLVSDVGVYTIDVHASNTGATTGTFSFTITIVNLCLSPTQTVISSTSATVNNMTVGVGAAAAT